MGRGGYTTRPAPADPPPAEQQAPARREPPIELRSDTFTRPTPEMRAAAAQAEVGDDVWGEDETVKHLEHRVAAMVAKEAALFFPSGTMANLAAVLTHCSQRGSSVIVGDQAHIYVYEQGGASSLGGVAFHVLPNADNGELPLDALSAALAAPDDPHFARPALVCVEQTHNRCGGAVLAPEYLHRVRLLARAARVPVHMDGARLANAAVAMQRHRAQDYISGAPWALAASGADTVSVCLSKGMGAPVGSVLCGPAAFIAQARRTRKALGGGMRQVGILAAPARVAVAGWHRTISADHEAARRLASLLARRVAGVEVGGGGEPQSNIVLFRPRVTDGERLSVARYVARLDARGVRVAAFRDDWVRAVTSSEVSVSAVEEAVRIIADVTAAWEREAGAGGGGGGGGAARGAAPPLAPAGAPFNLVQCHACRQWRRAPAGVAIPVDWICCAATWAPGLSCVDPSDVDAAEVDAGAGASGGGGGPSGGGADGGGGGGAAAAPFNAAQCHICHQWRRAPAGVAIPVDWICCTATWAPGLSCADRSDMDAAEVAAGLALPAAGGTPPPAGGEDGGEVGGGGDGGEVGGGGADTAGGRRGRRRRR